MLRIQVKQKAVIYDFFCLPPGDTQKFADSLLKNELARALEFSDSALNKSTTSLVRCFAKHGINFDDFCGVLVFSEEEI